MNGAHPSHDLLQRHHDGDLSGPTGDEKLAAELRAHVDACEICQLELASLDRLGGLLRTSARADLLGYGDGAEPDFTRMFAEIQKGIGESSAPNVVPLRPAGASGKKSGGSSRWLNRGAPALGAFALAAAALLMVFRSDTLPPSAPGEGPEQTPEVVASVNRSEIVKVEFGSNAGQVFDIPLSDGSSVPVVWIDDDEDEEE
jgi:hypothetical protein